MPDIQALPFSTFARASATDDGEHVVLQAHLAGRLATLAIPEAEVFRLMGLLSLAASGTARAKALKGGGEHAFPIEKTLCRPSRHGDGLVLTIRIPGGMAISFVGENERMAALALELGALAAPVGIDVPDPDPGTAVATDVTDAREAAHETAASEGSEPTLENQEGRGHRLTRWLRPSP